MRAETGRVQMNMKINGEASRMASRKASEMMSNCRDVIKYSRGDKRNRIEWERPQRCA